MRTGDYVKAAGDLIESGFKLVIGLAIAVVVAVVVVIALLVKIFVFPTENTAEPTTVVAPAISAPAPVVEIEYPKVTGLCFRTPMGDVGKVIGQQKDMLEMTFRGGVKSTYQFNQVAHTDCGVLPVN